MFPKLKSLITPLESSCIKTFPMVLYYFQDQIQTLKLDAQSFPHFFTFTRPHTLLISGSLDSCLSRTTIYLFTCLLFMILPWHRHHVKEPVMFQFPFIYIYIYVRYIMYIIFPTFNVLCSILYMTNFKSLELVQDILFSKVFLTLKSFLDVPQNPFLPHIRLGSQIAFATKHCNPLSLCLSASSVDWKRQTPWRQYLAL